MAALLFSLATFIFLSYFICLWAKTGARLSKATKLLERWAEVDIPSNVWSDNGEDYLLPLETQEFLKECEVKS